MQGSFLLAFILGVVQGATEFLPVSSSGHLTLLEHIFGLRPDLTLNVLLHLGTLVALLAYFRDELRELSVNFRRHVSFMLKIALMTLITGVIGLSLKGAGVLEDPRVLPLTFAVTTSLLLSSGKVTGRGKRMEDLTWADAVVIGLAQGLSVVPGISRSGTTIVTAMFLGYEPPEAFKLSFIGGIPAVLGAFLVELGDMGTSLDLSVALVGLLSALVVGFLSLEVLRKLTSSRKLTYFSIWTGLMVIASALALRG